MKILERNTEDYFDPSEAINEHFDVFFEHEGEEVARDYYKRYMNHNDAMGELCEDDEFMEYAREKFYEYLDRDPLELFV